MENNISIPAETQHQIDHIAEVCARRKPLVTISCITYNHEPYLRDALEGFVMQQTDFPFAAVVHEDASTDGTAAVLREYAERYPDIILPIYENENQYSKKDGALNRIMSTARTATGAKYIAMCEGDDYWTDPLKLQKQVDFLESHPDYTMCFHNAIKHYENSEKPDKLVANLETREYQAVEFALKSFTPTASILFRKSVIESNYYKSISTNKHIYVGDEPLFFTCLSLGKAYCLKQPMSVYRIHDNGLHHIVCNSPEIKRIKYEIALSRILPDPYKKYFHKSVQRRSVAAASSFYHGRFKDSLSFARILIKFCPTTLLKYFITLPIGSLLSKFKAV